MEQSDKEVKNNQPKISRRDFVKVGIGAGLAVLATGINIGVLLNRPKDQEKGKQDNILEQLQDEQLKNIKDRTWAGLTEVLDEGLFSKDSLKLDRLRVIKGSNLQIAKEEVKIEGSLRGMSRQLGVQFTLNFAKDLDPTGEGLKLDIASSENTPGSSLLVGERTGQVLKIDYFTGENAGDLSRSSLGGLAIVGDPQGMKKRFEDITGMFKKALKIPDDTPFIPEQDFNGLATFISQKHKTGYGLFISAREISGKGVTVDVTEGLLVDNVAWKDSAYRYRLVASKISFKELLRVSLEDLRKDNSYLAGGFRHVKDAPAAEYITKLGEQYLPDQPIQAKGR